MNRQLEEDVDRAWSSMSPRLRAEVEGAIGHKRGELPAETFGQLALSYLGSRLMEVRTERRVREGVDAIRRDVKEETRDFLDGLGQDVRTYLGRIAEGLKERDEKILYLVQNLQQQHALPPSSGSSGQQPPSAPPSNVYLNTTTTGDCQYRGVKEAERPKGCMIYEQGPDGRKYGTCTVGDQVRSQQILHLWFTTTLEKTGCPSNKWVSVCKYLINEKAPVTD